MRWSRGCARSPVRDAIGITIGDLTTTRVDGTFAVVYLVFNTIMNLTAQAAQVACFRNAAAHLEPGGCFVIEVGVPALRRLPPGERHVVFDATETHWGIDEYDVAKQGLSRTTSASCGRGAASSATRSRSATSGRRSST